LELHYFHLKTILPFLANRIKKPFKSITVLSTINWMIQLGCAKRHLLGKESLQPRKQSRTQENDVGKVGDEEGNVLGGAVPVDELVRRLKRVE